MEGIHNVVSELAIGRDIDPPPKEYQAIPFLPFFMVQAFASVQLLQGFDNLVLSIHAVSDSSKKMEPSPSMGTQEGLSLLTAIDSLGWGVCQEVLTNVLAQLQWKCSADSITWSQLTSSPIW